MSKEQDLRYIRTNQLLVNAFTDLLSRKKFEDITVNELCDLALVRRATFYTHFLDKYDFFAYFLRQHRDRFYEGAPTSETNSNFDEFFLYMCRQLIHYLNDHMDLVQNIMSSSAFSILLSILSEQIQSDLKTEFTANDAPPLPAPEILAAFYAGGLISILQIWLTAKNRMSEEELILQIGSLLESHRIFQ